MEIEIDNLEKLKEAIKYKGLGEDLYPELEANMKEGKPEFSLEKYVTIGEDDMAYRSNFRKDNEKNWYYFNTIDAALLKNADMPGEIREHSFLADQLITATEMHRMLKYGELVAVNKNLFNKEGQQYNTWLSIDISGPKNEYGNYPVNSYHENYFKKQPFDLAEALGRLPLPVKELENAQKREYIEKDLKKAHLPAVTILYNGEETTGYLSVNPKERRIDVLDASMQLIENLPQQLTEKNVAQSTSDGNQPSEELKKKSGQQQKVNWTKAKPGIRPSR